MALSPEQKDKILDRIKERTQTIRKCVVCGNNTWELSDGFFSMQENLSKLNLGGRGQPCVAVTCNNCGNTNLLNLMVLGLGDLIESPNA
jgi:predicted nucleic-acid-binding Zn-ribbon protein